MARIERATSPLPRECSTTEPHGHSELLCTQKVKRLLERVKGIEPSSSAWKAVALPLSYTREERFTCRTPVLALTTGVQLLKNCGGGSWIRTNVGARPTDLQSAPFNHSGIPPTANFVLCAVFFCLSSSHAKFGLNIVACRHPRASAWVALPGTTTGRA